MLIHHELSTVSKILLIASLVFMFEYSLNSAFFAIDIVSGS